jgi:hypothetical protein
LHHIADCPRLVIIAAAVTHTQAFGHGDLDMVDIVAVPDRFKDAIGKAKDQNILHGLFA